MPTDWPDLATVHAPAKRGNVEIEHRVVDEAEARFSRLRAVIGHPDELVYPGTYALLRIDGQIVMSDTRMERDSNERAVMSARGDVLIGGLGLGLVVLPIARREVVRSITVLELNPHVIALVKRPLYAALTPAQRAKLTIVEADVLTWKPPRGTRFDTIYFDIWPTISTQNLPEIARLHRRYAHYKRGPGSFMDSWQADRLRAERDWRR